MANLRRVVVVLLVITLVLSAVSVVFNLMIYNMKSVDQKETRKNPSNVGNVGFVVEENNVEEVMVNDGGR